MSLYVLHTPCPYCMYLVVTPKRTSDKPSKHVSCINKQHAISQYICDIADRAEIIGVVDVMQGDALYVRLCGGALTPLWYMRLCCDMIEYRYSIQEYSP